MTDVTTDLGGGWTYTLYDSLCCGIHRMNPDRYTAVISGPWSSEGPLKEPIDLTIGSTYGLETCGCWVKHTADTPLPSILTFVRPIKDKDKIPELEALIKETPPPVWLQNSELAHFQFRSVEKTRASWRYIAIIHQTTRNTDVSMVDLLLKIVKHPPHYILQHCTRTTFYLCLYTSFPVDLIELICLF